MTTSCVDGTFAKLFAKYGTDKHAPTGHAYGPVYDRLLAPLRPRAKQILEVGVYAGCSLRAWREYFSEAMVYGVDLHTPPLEEERISSRRADGTKADELLAVVGAGPWDLVVDDASHSIHDQVLTYTALRPQLAPGGLYVIEDVQEESGVETLRKMGFWIYDLRAETGRYDDVLAVMARPF